MNELPIIDLSPLYGHDQETESQLIMTLGDAFHTLGFAIIVGHGISADIVQSVRSATRDYFNLPLARKLTLTVSQDNYRGYIPLGFFTPNAGNNDIDLYEGFKLHSEVDENDSIRADCDLYGPNRWPDEIPNLRTAVMNYWHGCDRVTQSLLEALAIYLGLERQAFSKEFNRPLTNMTLLHYPPADSDKNNCGIHPHKDTDVLTLLSPDPVGGLYIRPTHSVEWIEAQAPENALIANVGDMLEIWSGGHFVSTPHKVENRTNHDRISFPYFAVPRYDLEIKPLCAPRSHKLNRCMHVGEVSSKIWRSNWPDAAPIEQCYDPYTT